MVQTVEFHQDGHVSNETHVCKYTSPNETSSALPKNTHPFKIHKYKIWFRGKKCPTGARSFLSTGIIPTTVRADWGRRFPA